MSTVITLFLLLISFAACANDQEIWARIFDLSTQLNKLEARFNQIPHPHKLGEFFLGGIVFYVDDTGQHGLIVSKSDATPSGLQWRNGLAGNKITNARGDGLQAGATNTRLIIAAQTIDNQKGLFAALAAANYQVLDDGTTPCVTPNASDHWCFSGWYLPSLFELQLLYKNAASLSVTLEPGLYWSSTEASVNKAWALDFATGALSMSYKANTLIHVRPVSWF